MGKMQDFKSGQIITVRHTKKLKQNIQVFITILIKLTELYYMCLFMELTRPFDLLWPVSITVLHIMEQYFFKFSLFIHNNQLQCQEYLFYVEYNTIIKIFLVFWNITL